MRVGFYVNSADPYETCMASTRIRVYDVIKFFLSKTNIVSEIHTKYHSYDVVIFQKCFQDEHIELAKALSKKGINVLFDINVNYVHLEGLAKQYVKTKQKENVLRMLEVSDVIITSSETLSDIYSKYHNSVVTIEENIENRFFEVNKHYESKDNVVLLYCGYAIKAKEILLIKEVLVKLYEQFSIRMLYICEEDPKINIIPYEFLKYNHSNLPSLLVKGDIKIAPRDLSNSYNWGHSFSKVAYPMSVGIPAVASPVPSYLGRNVVICNNDQEWYIALERLICSIDERERQGQSGKYITKQFSIDAVGNRYLNLFKELGYENSFVRS